MLGGGFGGGLVSEGEARPAQPAVDRGDKSVGVLYGGVGEANVFGLVGGVTGSP